ncbi:MAG: RNA 2',3'-cyclic phosphodiesterase [Bacteroidales bacterium]|nr:RNA 2',3'-cyclic phosphodiesterase [Bacteroidales bacterium]
MKRVFIAIDINNNQAVRRLLESCKSKLSGERIRWVSPENMHLTLAFLGERDEIEVQKSGDIMSELAQLSEAFQIAFSGTGVFRDLNHPRVIWIGLKVPDVLHDMRKLLCTRLKEEGLYSDEKPFRPHITIGRVKYISKRKALAEILHKTEENDLPPQEVNELILYESILKPGGPEYHALRTEALGSSTV